ncbi:MAG: lipopolysaccharide assembly protein LapB [Piscirickettsiaceae bacterium]|jgi:lipopolysaccharide biosynthesis regulator YciM|nr:lipopolysaccharide assembly protein LapB [Piscirickettsiaceae bacterium]
MEWLFLLLPVAAISGWVSARSHYKKRFSAQKNYFDPDYFTGLNYLLNEQPDKAIDVFIRLLEVNSDTVETHLALANLFRRRGETERAIRIHQNLIARPTLKPSQRDQALIELGLDYMSAGVLDRAEHLFLELLNTPSPPTDAYKHLLGLYQQQKNWQKAIDMAKKIQSTDPQKIGAEIAQFYCELAEQELEIDPSRALPLLKQANQFDAKCVRAALLGATVHIQSDHYAKALKSLAKIEQQDPNYLPEALPLLKTCYQALNKLPSFQTWLKGILARHPLMVSAHLMLAQVIEVESGTEKAQAYLQSQLQRQPSLEGLHHLLSMGDLNPQVLLPLVNDMTESLLQHGRRYVCQHCGFSGKTIHWHCPGCQHWGTIRLTELHFSSFDPISEH